MPFAVEETFVIATEDRWAVLVMPGTMVCPQSTVIDGEEFQFDIERTHSLRKNLRLQLQS